jgi:hypothetical protein
MQKAAHRIYRKAEVIMLAARARGDESLQSDMYEVMALANTILKDIETMKDIHHEPL